MYAQIIDQNGKTIVSASSSSKTCEVYSLPKIQKGVYVGSVIAKKMKEHALNKKANELKGKKIYFDRGGYLYHGVVKSVADAARKGGLEF